MRSPARSATRVFAGETYPVKTSNDDVSPDLTRERPKRRRCAVGLLHRAHRACEKEVQRLGDLQLVSGMQVETYIRTTDRTPLSAAAVLSSAPFGEPPHRRLKPDLVGGLGEPPRRVGAIQWAWHRVRGPLENR
jgi:hypothetical protein